jgi:hypothetical protein
MSKTHRRTGLAVHPAEGDRRLPPFVGTLVPQPSRVARTRAAGVGRRMPRDLELRIDLQTLFDDEPEPSPDGCGDLWQLIGLDRDALCCGADGLVRLTVA